MDNITFIGLGKLGLPFSLLIEKAGYSVTGVDISEEYVKSLNDKTFLCGEPYVNGMLSNSSRYRTTTDLKQAVSESKFIFILVNSGVTLDSYYDMNIVSDLLININKHANEKKNVVICSTVQIGYIDRVGKYLLEDSRYQHTLSYFPEFVRIGKVVEDITHCYTPFLIGSNDKHVQKFLTDLLKNICDIGIDPSIHVMSHESAEIAKLAGNCFKTIKISFSNLIGDICDKTPNTDKNQIMEAIKSDKMVREGCFKPGYGYGGPCFPRDNLEFSKFIKLLDINTCILDSTDEYNNYHTKFQARQLIEQDKDEYIFKNVCYRKDSPVPFIEASQKLKVAELVADSGKKVIIEDNEKVIRLVKKQYGNLFAYNVEKI